MTFGQISVSKKTSLVFPPHSAPFIIDWSRETYFSYISCTFSGRAPGLAEFQGLAQIKRTQKWIISRFFLGLPKGTIYNISTICTRVFCGIVIVWYKPICHFLHSLYFPLGGGSLWRSNYSPPSLWTLVVNLVLVIHNSPCHKEGNHDSSSCHFIPHQYTKSKYEAYSKTIFECSVITLTTLCWSFLWAQTVLLAFKDIWMWLPFS